MKGAATGVGERCRGAGLCCGERLLLNALLIKALFLKFISSFNVNKVWMHLMGRRQRCFL